MHIKLPALIYQYLKMSPKDIPSVAGNVEVVYFKGDSTGFVAPNRINNISVKKMHVFCFHIHW